MCMYEPSPLTKHTNTTPTHQAVRDCLQYRGPPDPLKGEAPYQMVREAAKETLEAIYETALRLEEWGAALRQFPSLLENPAVRRVFSLQVRSRRVLALPLRRPPYKPNHDAHTTHTAVPPLRHLGRRGPRQSREPPTGGPGPRRGPDPRLRHPLPPRVGKHAHTRGLDVMGYCM